MWSRREKLVAIQNHIGHTHQNPGIEVVTLQELLADIGVNGIDEFKQEIHQVGAYPCRIVYNRGYYMASVDDYIESYNHHTDMDLKFDTFPVKGLLRTFKTRQFVLEDIRRHLSNGVVPSAPPLD